jgi:ABC-2 type transport system permease protein
MTILGPILMAALMIVPIWLTTMEDEDTKIVAVIDNQKNDFANTLKDSKSIKFEYITDKNIDQLRKSFNKLNYYALLYNPDSVNYSPDSITLSSNKQPSLNVKSHIANAIEKKIEAEKLRNLGIDENILKTIKTNVNIKTIKWTKEGKSEKSSTEVIMGVGFVAAMIIYMFIFIYGAQVMLGVIEEKTNRIVEIMISSVRPFELMMGKIVGVSLVALTQFVLWIVLTLGIFFMAQNTFLAKKMKKDPQFTEKIMSQNGMSQIKELKLDEKKPIFEVLETLYNVPWVTLGFTFLFYFLGGYLLYSSLFAAIGAAVDNEADSQQFMLPLTIPLILAIVMAQAVIQNPEGPLAFWFSIFPFTSPVIMMIRIAFGVPAWEMALSMVLLVLTFIGTTWMAAKIYRTGVLMYGKKINYKELWKWLRYSN